MICPICKLPLLESGRIDYGIDYYCRNRITFEGYRSVPHYIHNNNGIGMTIDLGSYWYAPPYRIRRYDGISYIGLVNKLPEADTSTDKNFKYRKPDFTEVFKTQSEFHPDDPVKTAERIKKLIIFS